MQNIFRDVPPVETRAVTFRFWRIFFMDRLSRSDVLRLGVLRNCNRLGLLRLLYLRRLFRLRRRLFCVLRYCRKSQSNSHEEDKYGLTYHMRTPSLDHGQYKFGSIRAASDVQEGSRNPPRPCGTSVPIYKIPFKRWFNFSKMRETVILLMNHLQGRAPHILREFRADHGLKKSGWRFYQTTLCQSPI